MKRFLIVVMVLGVIGGSVATAEAEESSETTERTVEGSYGPLTGCNVGTGPYVCAVVQTRPTEAFFTAKVTDAHGQPVFVQVITGDGRRVVTFCGETTGRISFAPGSSLEFIIEPTPNFWSNWGIEWLGPLDCPYRVKTTGTISVTLSEFEEPTSPSPEPVESPAPPSSPSGQTDGVERSVDLALRRHLRGTGSVVAEDASCISEVPVVIQRKTSDAWLDIASTTTDSDGAFALRLTDRAGRYRASASEVGGADSTCLVARSATVRHHH